MAFGLSPVEDLKKKVELLSTRIESLSESSSQSLIQRIEELEDLQLLEKLNSIEMREELQNIRNEIENLGIVTQPAGNTGKTDLDGRIKDLETQIQEISILASATSGRKDKIDWDAIKEDIIEQVKGSMKPVVVQGETTFDIGSVEQSILQKVDERLSSFTPGTTPAPAVSASVDTKVLEDMILDKVDEKIKSLKPGMLTGLFSKSPSVDIEGIRNALRSEIKNQIENDIKFSFKSEIKGELLSDVRTMVDQEVRAQVGEIPTAGVTRADLKTKLSQFKNELIESIAVEKAIDKKLVPVIRSFENLEGRFAKNDSQLTTLFTTLPREIKLLKDDFNIRLETHDKTIDQLRRETKEIRLGGVEGYQYLATKEEARRVADEKVNVLRNEILANKLAGEDEKYEEALNRIIALDDRFSVFKAEVLPTIERLADLDRIAMKVADIEDHMNNVIHDKLSALDPSLINNIVMTVDAMRQRLDAMEREPSEFVKRSLDSIRLGQDRDRDAYEKIAQFVHLETERMQAVNDDIKSTVVARLEQFEKRMPPEDVWIEIEAMRSRIFALEKSLKETNIKRRSIAQPAIIE